MKRDGGDQRPLFPRFNFPESLSPAPAPGGRIGFTSRDNGVWRVFSARPDGTDLQRESDAGGDYWAPVFDGKGGRMICHGPADGQEAPVILGDGKRFEGTGVPGTFVVSAVRARLPDREVELRAVRAAFPAYDPASGLIVGADHFKSVITARPDGTELRRVFRPPEPRTSTWGPAWSPDGRWIATAVGPTFAGVGAPVDVWKFRPDGTGAVNLTPNAGGSDGFPFFSPDGGSIVMRSDRDGNMEIYRMGSDGANAVRLTRHDATDTMPAFSPAGDTVAFVSARDGNFEIYSLPLHPEGRPGEPRRLTDSPGHDMHPKFSPDGRWIVFASERGGLNDEEPLIPVFNPQPYGEIFALRLADGLTVRLTHNKWEDGTPSWASVR
jgi:Tol biopolymer transport system component